MRNLTEKQCESLQSGGFNLDEKVDSQQRICTMWVWRGGVSLTPLAWAVMNESKDKSIVKALLEQGADPFQRVYIPVCPSTLFSRTDGRDFNGTLLEYALQQEFQNSAETIVTIISYYKTTPLPEWSNRQRLVDNLCQLYATSHHECILNFLNDHFSPQEYQEPLDYHTGKLSRYSSMIITARRFCNSF